HRVGGEERKPEAVLPADRTVTRPGVAPESTEQCRDVPLVRRVFRRGRLRGPGSRGGKYEQQCGEESAHWSAFSVSVRSQSFAVLSQLPAASSGFFGANARQSTSPEC